MMKRIMVLVCIVAGLYQFIAIALHNSTPFWTVAVFYVSFLLWLLMDKE